MFSANNEMSLPFPKITKEIILASSSISRRQMLEAAGLEFGIQSPDVDEGAVLESFENSDLLASDIAEVLARAKAETVSARSGSACVIGGDQILSYEGRIISKSVDLDAARKLLLELKGKTHRLHSAVAVAVDGETRWAHVETAHLLMRDFSPTFLGTYLGTVGEEICRSVGCYELEGLGVNLFDKIDGDHFTVRGMPLISLLNYLYRDGVLV